MGAEAEKNEGKQMEQGLYGSVAIRNGNKGDCVPSSVVSHHLSKPQRVICISEVNTTQEFHCSEEQ